MFPFPSGVGHHTKRPSKQNDDKIWHPRPARAQPLRMSSSRVSYILVRVSSGPPSLFPTATLTGESDVVVPVYVGAELITVAGTGHGGTGGYCRFRYGGGSGSGNFTGVRYVAAKLWSCEKFGAIICMGAAPSPKTLFFTTSGSSGQL